MENETKELKMFINKVNSRKGWIDYIDAFRLVNIYTNAYGILSTTLPVEDELIYMWHKINKIEIKEGVIEKKIGKNKICFTCKKSLAPDNFSKDMKHKDRLDTYCKSCKSIYAEKYNIKKRKKK